MARIARIVVPGIPHHVTQRGNRRQKTFFCEQDYRAYINLLSTWCRKNKVEIWAYCLMPNHVHLVAVPETMDGLTKAISETHCRYTRLVNFREGWRGHLWQGRFASFPMDEKHLLAAARYIEQNPVAAGLVSHAEDYQWSSAAAHLEGKDDKLVAVAPLLRIIPNWREFLLTSVVREETQALKAHESTGRPLGTEDFISQLEVALMRDLRKRKPGPKPRSMN